MNRAAGGALLQAPGSRHGDKVFFCRVGHRHWVADTGWFHDNDYRWPEDVHQVAPEVLDSFLPGRSAPRVWEEAAWRDPPRHSSLKMREVAVSRLHGSGIEVGAGASPLPVPLSCKVRYVDVFNAEELRRQIYAGQALADLIVPDIIAPFENLTPIPDGTLDFVVACHVIEHTRNPIGAIADAWRKITLRVAESIRACRAGDHTNIRPAPGPHNPLSLN